MISSIAVHNVRSSASPMRVLILGTSGQLATELRRAAAPSGIELCDSEKVDLANEEQLCALLTRHAPRLVINAAAYTAVDRAETESKAARAVNALGPASLATWCRDRGAALFHVSTDYVFDGSARVPYRETDTTAPLGVYGATKLEGENAVRSTLERHVIVRTSWVFSAIGHNFAKTMVRLAGERDSLRVVADQIGRPTSAAALAGALWLMADRVRASSSFPWGTYHFANHGETSWHCFASAIIALQAVTTGRRPAVDPITSAEYPTPVTRPAYSVLDTSRFEATFGVRPRHWQDELPEVVHRILRAS